MLYTTFCVYVERSWKKGIKNYLITNLKIYRKYTSIEALELSLHSRIFAVLVEGLEGLESSLLPAGHHN